jgi:uncharacterized protein YkwD
MNWIDILLLLIVLLSALGGWRKGFIVGAIELVVWLGSLFIGFVGYPYVAGWLEKAFPSLGVWLMPLSFLLVVILSRWLLSYLFERLIYTTPRDVHYSAINRTLGIAPGIINGLIWITIISAVLIAFPLNDKITATARESKVANEVSVYVEWLDAKLSPVFDKAVNRTISKLTVDPSSKKKVDLHFTVTNAKPQPDLESQMLVLVNNERAKANLPALKPDPEMVPVARAHSQDMFARSYFSHVTPEGKTPAERVREGKVKYLTMGENLALGPTLKICHEGLMNSPGHRANILRSTFGRVGIGILDGGRYGLMITQNFRN